MDSETLMIAALAALASMVPLLGVCIWCMVRDRRHQCQAQADQRRWVLQRQLWDMERQIRDEGLTDEEREWTQQVRARQAEITREVRRRLGLPEEEPPAC